MPLKIVRNDITLMQVDAIVNAANNSLLGGGGVDGCIHRAAGPKLLEECRTLGGCATGQAKITGAYELPCKYVIHTVGPIWQGGEQGERARLVSCYRESLKLALAHKCETVAFPLISAGVYGYPKDQAIRVAVDTISDFLLKNELLVYIVIYDRASYKIGEKLYCDIAQFIDDLYVQTHTDPYDSLSRRMQICALPVRESSVDECAPYSDSFDAIEALIGGMDEGFSATLLRLIDNSGMTDVQCYKKANVDRKLFSKIRSDIHYRPSKSTVIAFAIALELTLQQTQDLLKKAGFALSHSSKFDIIIEYFIRNGNYNVFKINEALFAFDQNLLGL